jgi:putative lipoic acid-binding regulatory protein
MSASRQEAIDLLNATHDFPTYLMIKVVGVNDVSFVSRVVVAVREQLSHTEDPSFRTRETPGGRHVSVTLEPWIDYAEQVLLVYDRLRTIEGVVFLL